jgi:hypothetical protein
MKKRILMLTTGLTLAIIPASAQWRHFGGPPGPPYQPTELTGYVGVGFSEPVNPLANRLNTGFNAAAGIGITKPYVGVMFDAMFQNFGLSDLALSQVGAHRGSQQYWAFTVDPIVHVNPRGPVDFYVTGGGGLYGQNTRLRLTFVTPQNQTFDATSNDTRYGPGVNGGAGFAFNVSHYSRAKFFMEARYHHMFLQGRDADFIPVTLGVRF